MRRGEEEERLGLGASTSMACRQQREGGSFTGPRGLGRACGPTGLVCSCYCVRTATVADGGGGALPRADGADALVLALILRRAILTSRCRGETARGPQDRVGARWWLVWWQAPGRPRCGLGSGETPVGVADSGAVAPVGAACPSGRASGATLPIASSCTGGNPWQQRHHRRDPSWRC